MACILGELIQASLFSLFRDLASPQLTGPLFQGISDIDQMVQISNFLGTPNSDNWREIESMPDFGKIIFNEQPPLQDLTKYFLDKVQIPQEVLSEQELS